MDAKFLAEVGKLVRSEQDSESLVAALSRSLRKSSHKPLSAKAVRDRFTETLRAVRSGRVQLVGAKPKNQVVIISLNDLARVVRMASHDVSFGEALRMQPGFQPVPTRAEMRQRPRGKQAYTVPDSALPSG